MQGTGIKVGSGESARVAQAIVVVDPTTGAAASIGGGTQYAEDAVHSSGATGTLALVVRKDTATSLAGADGDYSGLIVDANGRLWVNVGAALMAGDVAHDSADSGNPIKFGAVARSAAPTAVTAGDRVNLSADTYGSLRTLAVDSAGAVIDPTATVNVAQDSAVMKLASVSVTPKFASISASSSGDNTIVAAVTSKKIRVLAYNLMGAGAVNARWQTAAAGAYLTGLKYIAAAGGGICAPFNPVGWFETVAGDLLNLELSGAVAVGGEVVYIEV